MLKRFCSTGRVDGEAELMILTTQSKLYNFSGVRTSGEGFGASCISSGADWSQPWLKEKYASALHKGCTSNSACPRYSPAQEGPWELNRHGRERKWRHRLQAS